MDRIDLSGFTGTADYHVVSPFLGSRFLCTDGVRHLAEEAEAYWLIDAISSHQNMRLFRDTQGLQVWTLRKLRANAKNDAMLECHDGNGRRVRRQPIPFTDFPFDRVSPDLAIWVERGSVDGTNPAMIAMLPGER